MTRNISKIAVLTISISFAVFSNSALAKYTHVDGTIANVNSEEKTISIVENDSGETKTYRYAERARVKNSTGTSTAVNKLRKGEDITLILKKIDK